MIWYYIILFFTTLLDGVLQAFSLPQVTHLPVILGVDTDASLIQAVGFFDTLIASVWVIRDIYIAFLFFLGYLAIKLVLRTVLGHRAPQ